MRAIAVVLLGLSLSLGAATVAGAEEEKETETCPWKEGEVIKAEFVWSAWIEGGYIEASFMMSDGTEIDIVRDTEGNCREAGGCDRITSEEVIEQDNSKCGGGILDDLYLGRQMLVTFERLNWVGEKGGWYGIKASRVRLNRDPEAPHNIWIIPNQKLRGKIFCSDPGDDSNIYLRTQDKKWYRLTPGWSFDLSSFLLFCKVRKSITLKGDFLPQEKEKNIFQTRTHPEEFFSER